MRNFILCLLCMFAVVSCSRTAIWSEAQKGDFRERIKALGGDLTYVGQMTEQEFDKFANDVTSSVQSTYPDYSVFVELPSVDDTLTTYVVTRFAYDVDSDYRNLRNLYTYHQLVREGVLPEGLSGEAKEAFYACLASKIRGEYESIEFFLGALTLNGDASQQAAIFQQQCAMELGAAVMIEEQITK